MYTGQDPAELALQLTKYLLFGLTDKKPSLVQNMFARVSPLVVLLSSVISGSCFCWILTFYEEGNIFKASQHHTVMNAHFVRTPQFSVSQTHRDLKWLNV